MNDDQATTERGGASRRALLLGAGAVGATTVLAACGDDSGTDNPGTGAPGATQTPSPGAGGGALAKTSEIPEGGGKIFTAQGVVVTQPTAGTFKAFTNICTHMNCPVAAVAGGTINCTCHGSKYSIADGSVKTGPATNPLAEKQITVTGDAITLG
ncbi:MAG TPA: Rieske (2Fe-2S) protein [Pilimelia sp.]|nr:Rieske (2Fe-2S) protein [Pilimelia sp.]